MPMLLSKSHVREYIGGLVHQPHNFGKAAVSRIGEQEACANAWCESSCSWSELEGGSLPCLSRPDVVGHSAAGGARAGKTTPCSKIWVIGSSLGKTLSNQLEDAARHLFAWRSALGVQGDFSSA